LATTELGQLLKFPAFVQHYKEHKSENKDLTLAEFLMIHYSHGIVKDADYEKDMKLPFKTTGENSFSITAVASTPQTINISVQELHFFESKKKYFVDEHFIPTSFFSNIWQPPKVC
jgi:hypothetical protein